MTVAAAEVAIGLRLIVAIYRNRNRLTWTMNEREGLGGRGIKRSAFLFMSESIPDPAFAWRHGGVLRR
jgi:hypothetical protein